MTVSLVSHAVAAVAYAAFALLVILSGNRRGLAAWFVMASLATVGWAAAVAVAAAGGEERGLPELTLETARSGAWVALLWRFLATRFPGQPNLADRSAVAGFAALLASAVAADALLALGLAFPGLATFALLTRLALPIIGLMLIENLARNDRQAFWSTRFLFAGLGGLFAYDLFLYSQALLLHQVDTELYAARGAVDALAVPVMAVALARNPSWSIDLHVSRHFVFHSMTLVGSGAYLLLMSLAGYYLRTVGGTWGPLLQIVFLSSALVVAFITMSSGTFRSWLRLFISRHFFSYKYDYRHEWLRFISHISAQEPLLSLHDRIVQATADIFDCPAGTLWLRDELEERFTNTAAWNTPVSHGSQPVDPAMVDMLERRGLPIALNEDVEGPPHACSAGDLPDWIRALPRGWMLLPLVHRGRLRGLLVLMKPRAPRELNAEDYDLLSTVGRQAASYLAEEQAGNALADARQLESFNRRFAFVVHDVKNLASQLSLILKNAELHGDNPEFHRDVLSTVQHSVARMNGLLEQLGVERRKGANPAAVDLAELIRREWGATHPAADPIQLALPPAPLVVEVDEEQLARVVRHIVQNAIDALTGRPGRVEIRLFASASHATLEVIDDGPGMTAEFIRDHLFRPFDSTKKSGYGIGAYQARQIVREMGGRLEVASEPGKGTTFSIQFPLARETVTSLPETQDA